MSPKWMVRLGSPILALALVSACSATDNQQNNAPQDTNVPNDESPNNEDMRHNEQDMDVPDKDGNNRENEKQNENPNNYPENNKKYDDMINGDKSHTTQ